MLQLNAISKILIILCNMYTLLLVLVHLLLPHRSEHALNIKPFPEGFLLGTASSSYQVEGAWNESGKGASIWDTYTHARPDVIKDCNNADITCDSYHKIKEDVALLRDLGVHYYRFSLSWTRILPKGYANFVNPEGINYYNALIDELVTNKIHPMVTIYHWDLPQTLQDIGGWPNGFMEQYFEDYARIAFQTFGDRVKLWITINEPRLICLAGYGGKFAPGIASTGIGSYLCGHTVLKAHARVYHLYKTQFQTSQKGKVGITIDSCWFEAGNENTQNLDAQERRIQFEVGWFANPIFHPNGDYPTIMKDRIANRSNLEGFPYSRLPILTESEKRSLIKSSDFFGLNHYTTFMVVDTSEDEIGLPNYEKDVRVRSWPDPSWPSTKARWAKVVPWGLTKLLKWIKDQYGNPEIYITENGYCGEEEINDVARVKFHQEYISAMLDAIYEHNVNVKAYTVWSFLDSFEWIDGYENKYGLHHVNFGSSNRTRTPKLSARIYKDIIKNRCLGNLDI